MSEVLIRVRQELGVPGFVALALLALAVLFFVAAVRPLQERLARADRELRQAERRATVGPVSTAASQSQGPSTARFYRFFESQDGKAVWLAKVHMVAIATGLELRSAEYRLVESPGDIERYQIIVPVAGSYPQIWAFLESVLAEIPTLSLDHVMLRRKNVGEPRAEAELSFTLHLIRR